MAQWLVMRGDSKTPAGSLAEIEAMARHGQLSSGDMVQPPGTTEWMYVGEVPELKVILDKGYGDDDDAPSNRGLIGGAAMLGVAGVLGVAFLAVILIGGGTMMWVATQMESGQTTLMGSGLTYSQMLVTAQGATLRTDPVGSAKVSTSVDKDDVLELLAKRGEFYKARTKGGAEGWIPQDQVIPLYQLADHSVKAEYDPLYNPEQYVNVANASWMQLPAERPGAPTPNVTVFEFMMSNNARYPMTDLKIVATIKDAQGHELERIEIPIEGMIPANGDTMVGTLAAEVEVAGKRSKPAAEGAPDRILTAWTFEQLAADDPELQLRYTSGVEIEMTTENFANAEITLVELRAVPDAKATVAVRSGDGH